MDPTLLIADDSATIRGFVKLVLRGQAATLPPFQLIEAEDGEVALLRARTTFPALALIDLHMPNLDGLGALKALRAESDPRLRELPVLLLTAERGEDLRAQCLAAGANGFLDKPLKQPQLLEAVRRYLSPAGPQ